MSKHYSEEFKDKIILRNKNGEGVYALAKEYKIGSSTIYKWLRKKNLSNVTTGEVINLKELFINEPITLSVNGLDIKIDSKNLNKLLKAIKND